MRAGMRWVRAAEVVGCAVGLLVYSIDRPALAQSDVCASATPIGIGGLALPMNIWGVTTTGFTTEPTDPLPSCRVTAGQGGQSAWFFFVAPATATYQVDTYGTDYPTAVVVYRTTGAACNGPLAEIACYEPRPGFAVMVSGVRFMLAQGESALIEIIDSTPGGGGGTLAVNAYEVATLRSVVASGDADPIGGAFARVSGPALTKTRRMSFTGTTEGVFLRDAGLAFTTLAVSGDLAPGTGGGTFRSFGRPAINDSGEVVFHAAIDGGSAAEGIFFRPAGGAITPVALTGDPAPFGSGAPLRRFGSNPDVNSSGAVAYTAEARVDSYSPREQAVVRWAGGPSVVLASSSDPDPCGGGTLDRLVDRGDVALNDFGMAAFLSDSGIHAYTGGGLTAVVCDNDPAPIGGTFSRFGEHPVIHDSALLSVGFVATTGTPMSSGVFLSSPWLCAGPSLCGLAQQGAPAPGGGAYLPFSLSRTVADFSAAGNLAFSTETDLGDAVFVFNAADGTVSSRVVEGDGCTGSPGVVVEAIGRVVSFSGGVGDVALDARCTIGVGIFSDPTGAGPLAPVASRADMTTAGAGFAFVDASANGMGDVVFRGERTSMLSVGCTSKLCNPPALLASPTDTVPGAPGSYLDEISQRSLVRAGSRTAFMGRMLGAASSEALFSIRDGDPIELVAIEGDAVNGSGEVLGAELSTIPGSSGEAYNQPAFDGRNAAFVAALSPSARGAVVLAQGGQLDAVAIEGDPAPNGANYGNFQLPAVRGRHVLFVSETSNGWCVFERRTPTRTDVVACQGDAVALPVGGSISTIGSRPGWVGGEVGFPATISGGTSANCFLLSRRGVHEPLVCEGDRVPFYGGPPIWNGAEVYDLFVMESGLRPAYDRRGSVVHLTEILQQASFPVTVSFRALLATDPSAAGGGLSTTRVAGEGEATPLGGVFGAFGDAAAPEGAALGYSAAQERVAFEATIHGGSAGSAVFLAE